MSDKIRMDTIREISTEHGGVLPVGAYEAMDLALTAFDGSLDLIANTAARDFKFQQYFSRLGRLKNVFGYVEMNVGTKYTFKENMSNIIGTVALGSYLSGMEDARSQNINVSI